MIDRSREGNDNDEPGDMGWCRMQHKTTFEMTIAQLRQLFEAGQDVDDQASVSTTDEKRDLLEYRLTQGLPLGKEQVQELPEVLGDFCRRMGQLGRESLGDILKRPSSDLKTIKQVSRLGKTLAEKAHSKEERDTATAIYYAAIAHAMVFHNRRITRLSYATLQEAFSRLIRQSWVPRELVNLFKLAHSCCHRKNES